MDKQAFLDALRKGLSGFPQEDIDQRLAFYSEMIDDRMEEGLSEEAAVAAMGPVNEIVSQIVGDVPLSKLVKETAKSKRRLKTWEIILLVLGAPIWLSLLVAVLSVAFSLLASMGALIISLWAVAVSAVAVAIGALGAAGIFAFRGHILQGVCMLGAALICAGFAIFLFLGTDKLTKGTILLVKKTVLGIKMLFAGKGMRNG